MTKKIFKSTFLVSLITLIASIVIIMGILFNYFNNELTDRLAEEVSYAASGVEVNGIEYLNAVKTVDNDRITWIAPNGDVIYDSQSKASEMENHSKREEFCEAIKTGTGMSSRYSSTRSENTIYYAVLLKDGSVLRVSTTQAALWTLFLGMLQPIAIVIAAALVFSIILSTMTSKRILKPINAIDLNNPYLEEDYEEFSPLLHKIINQNKMIEMQMSELSRQRDEFKIITENMSEGLLIIDSKTDLLMYNSAALKLLGANEPEEGVSVLSLNRSENFIKSVDEALSGQHSMLEMICADSYRQIIANPVYSEEQVCGAVIIIMDTTEKEKREQLRREFTSNVSHELKTPLTSIYGMSEILMSGQVNNDIVKDFSTSIHEETGRLITLINDIIRLSQLDEGSVPQERVDVDLFEIAHEVVNRLKPIAEKNKVKIELYGESAIINGVPVILNEIVYNLCENAIKYNVENGQVKISVADKGSSHVELKVEDTGIGIPPEDLDRIFERFYRVDKSHSKTIGGTGLGLSIVKHGIAFHNAKLSIKSILGEGTVIKLDF